jgi:hypothetical protein
MDLTTNVDLIQRCVSAKVVADCNDGCKWRHGKNVPATPAPTPGQGTPLFTAEFCHPAKIDKTTPTTEYTKCVAQTDAALCSIANGCIWSDGKE